MPDGASRVAGVVDPLEAEDDNTPTREPSFAGVVDDIEEDYEGDNSAFASLAGLGPKKKTAGAPRKKKKLALALNDLEFAKAVEVMELNAGQLMTNPQKSSRITEFKTFEQLDTGEDEEEDLADSLWADEPEEAPEETLEETAPPVEDIAQEPAPLEEPAPVNENEEQEPVAREAAYSEEEDTVEENDWEDETAYWANQATAELSQPDPASENAGGEAPDAVEAIEAGEEDDTSEAMPSLSTGGGKAKKLDALGFEVQDVMWVV